MNYNRADTRSCCGAKQEPTGRRGVVWCAISPATGTGRSSPSGRDATKLRTGNWLRRRRRRRLGYGVCAAATPGTTVLSNPRTAWPARAPT